MPEPPTASCARMSDVRPWRPFYALYRTEDDRYFATDGLCTHEQVELADGFVSGTIIECPMHNGRFDFTTGEAKGAPACVNLVDLSGEGRARPDSRQGRLNSLQNRLPLARLFARCYGRWRET